MIIFVDKHPKLYMVVCGVLIHILLRAKALIDPFNKETALVGTMSENVNILNITIGEH